MPLRELRRRPRNQTLHRGLRKRKGSLKNPSDVIREHSQRRDCLACKEILGDAQVLEGEEKKLPKLSELKIGDDLTQTHICVDADQEFTRCGNHPNILPLFGRLGRSLTSLLSSLRHEAHPHHSENENLKQRRGRGIPPTTTLWVYL
jgi:hypothetical protein